MISIPCLRQCLTSRSASANAFFGGSPARVPVGVGLFDEFVGRSGENRLCRTEYVEQMDRPFRAYSRREGKGYVWNFALHFRIRQSPNEFGSASFGRNRRFRTRFGASVSGCKDRFLPIKMQSCPEVLQKREIFVYLQTRSRESGSDGRVARQRSAKPCTAVRIRFRPHRNRVADSCNAVFVWYKYNMYFFEEWLPVVFD